MEIELDEIDHSLTYMHVVCAVSQDGAERRYFVNEHPSKVARENPGCNIHIYHVTVTYSNTHMTLTHAETKLRAYYVKVDGHWTIDSTMQAHSLN